MASFAPEVIFISGGLPITNTVINTILVDGFLLILAFAVRRRLALIPGKFLNLIEYIIGGLYDFGESIAGDKIKFIFPFFATFFLFIIVANWSGLIPGNGTIGIYETSIHGSETVTHLVPINRPLTSDLNSTFALAIISLVATHIYAIRVLGVTQYLSKFFAFIPFIINFIKRKPINVNFKDPLTVFISLLTPLVFIFVGILELISEFVKVISLSFRLFGNIYAGEVVLLTVSDIFAFIFPIPFMMLELIVGFVQALVFAMLTMVFMIILSTPHHEESKEVSS
jgi:F-type H+-transporting ATPase subunit a